MRTLLRLLVCLAKRSVARIVIGSECSGEPGDPESK
jgi:hypothetical protein